MADICLSVRFSTSNCFSCTCMRHICRIESHIRRRRGCSLQLLHVAEHTALGIRIGVAMQSARHHGLQCTVPDRCPCGFYTGGLLIQGSDGSARFGFENSIKKTEIVRTRQPPPPPTVLPLTLLLNTSCKTINLQSTRKNQ